MELCICLRTFILLFCLEHIYVDYIDLDLKFYIIKGKIIKYNIDTSKYV